MEARFDELVNEILSQNTIDENFLKKFGTKVLPYVAAGAIGAGLGLSGKSTKPVKPEGKRPVPVKTVDSSGWRSQEDISLKKQQQQQAREKMMQQKTGKTKEQREQRLKDVDKFIKSQNQ